MIVLLKYLLRISLTLYLGVLPFFVFGQETVRISGYIRAEKSLEELLFVTIQFPELNLGTQSNQYGFYSIELPKANQYSVLIRSTDYLPFSQTFSTQRDTTINFLLKNSAAELDEVVVTAKKSVGQENIKNTEISVLHLDIKEAKLLPALGGETDVIKVAQLLPGINRGVEGGTDFFVRGGDGDQNLILVDEATVYNPGHLFGFFSVFNPDVIKDMTIYKGGFPANYSGRLSSITDIRTIDGDKTKIHGTGGIGLLSSRLTLEGPIYKNKVSFLISGRRSYIDQVFKLVGQVIPYYFYDFNAKVNVILSNKDRIFISSYLGNDVLDYEQAAQDSTGAFGSGFKLGNFTQSARWTHIYNQKLFSNLSVVHTRFKYDIFGEFDGNNILIKSSVRDIGAKYDFQYFKTSDKKISYGLHLVHHGFRPNVINTSGEISEFLASKEGPLISNVETNAYINFLNTKRTRWKFEWGFSVPMSFVKQKTYSGISPRFNSTYIVSEKQSLKFSFSHMYQYMHRVSSSSVALPTDLWYPVSKKVLPQSATQLAVSYNWYFPKKNASMVLETYIKGMNNLTEYKEGSKIILNDNFEDLLVQGRGSGAGIEFMYKKEIGKLSGWIAYTISVATRQFDSLNGGKEFYAKYDRRHYFTLVGIWKLNQRTSFSFIGEMASGSRFTPIIGQYVQPNAGLTGVELIPIYAERNSYRLASSIRFDINFVVKRKEKKNARFDWEWHFGAYNFFNRATPYRIKIDIDENGKYSYSQPGLFGFIPSIAYNFKF